MINTEHPRTVAQRSRCLWTISPNGSLWLLAFTKAFNLIVIKLHPAQRKKAALQVSCDYRDLCKGCVASQKQHLGFTCRQRWESKVGDEEPRKPACMRTKKSKGVPGKVPGWLHRLECLLQSRLKARLIWLRCCHWWFLRGLECSPAKSRSHLRSSREKREKRFVIPLNANAGHLHSRGKPSPFADLIEWT